jgi:hypothetical protein
MKTARRIPFEVARTGDHMQTAGDIDSRRERS